MADHFGTMNVANPVDFVGAGSSAQPGKGAGSGQGRSMSASKVPALTGLHEAMELGKKLCQIELSEGFPEE